jgi:3-dehydroquinate synthetase
VLNFGHTVAHAVEAATGYRVPHGEAVAIGLVAEARLAERMTGLPRAHSDRIEALLSAFELPVRAPSGIDSRRLVRAMSRDKKSRAGIVRCALPERIGRMPAGDDPTVPVDPARELTSPGRAN